MNLLNFRLLTRFCCDVPLLSEGALVAFTQRFDQPQAAEHPQLAKLRETLAPKAQIGADGVAMLSINGTLANRPDPFEQIYYGMEDTAALMAEFESIARSGDVRGILLDFNSPGGFMNGGPEFAELVKATDKVKPVVTWTGGMLASLAYWIGSQAREVIASRASIVGSIGAYRTFADYSRMLESAGVKIEVFKNAEGEFKAAGIPGTSLTEGQRANIQAGVQSSFDEFKADILAARPNVQADAMRGQTFSGRTAKAVGLVDRVGSKADALAFLRMHMRRG